MDALAGVDGFSFLAAVCFWGAMVWSQRLDRGFPVWLRRLAWPALGLWLVAALVVGRGPWAALAASPALLFALWLLAFGLRRFLADDRSPATRRGLELLAATGPLVAAIAWVWSRYDRTFAGFPDPLATLTTVHFAITFGVLPLAMAAWERRSPPSERRSVGLGLCLLAAPATALAFALRSNPWRSGAVEFVCVLLFAAGFLLWASGMPVRRGPGPYVCLVPGFLLGVGYTAANTYGWAYLALPQMAALHGTLNLVGALWLAAQAPAFDEVAPPAPDQEVAVDGCALAEATFVDAHRQVLGPWSPEAFARLKAALLGYRFYPDTVMVRRTQFEDEGRPVRVGDRLGLGLLLPNIPGLPPFLLPAIVEVDLVESTAESARLGYVTTRRHYGRGHWSAEVRREGDQLVLAVDCHVRPSRWYVRLGQPVYRRFQLAAFHAGVANLRSLP